MSTALLAAEALRILRPDDEAQDEPLEVSDARVGLALIQLAAGKEVTAVDLGPSPEATTEDALRVMTRRMLTPSAPHYAVLGVPRTASGTDIRENDRRLIALVHPDSRPKGLPGDSAIQVNLAYAVLSDPAARARYDASLVETADAAAGEASAPSQATTRSPTVRAQPTRGSRFEGLVSMLTARRSLIWMAGLLMLPLVWVLASRSSTEPPAKLIEARPKLQLDPGSELAGERRASPESVSSTSVGLGMSPATSGSPSTMALAASRSLTIESERKIAGATPADPATPAAAAATPLTSPTSPSRDAHVSATANLAPATRGREVAGSDVGTLRPVLAELPAREIAAGPGPAVPELLAQLADAVESGSVERLGALLGERMPGRAAVLSDFDNVFRSTRKRELRYVRIDQQGQARPQTFSGVAELGLTSMDGTTSTQRLFLSGAVERRGDRVQLARWSSHPVQ